uniref:Uncharacterized protein n=1 Tax=Anopheles christyi TaxID=43041 RepID=A0A182K6U9_9DIPT
MNPQSRAHRKPPDVEEALSSMLWTPYDNGISESDSSDETEVLHRVNNNNHSSYSFFGTGANPDHRRRQQQHQQHQQSLMRRSLSAWSYRSRTGKPAPVGESEVGNRFSYPYYDQSELGFGAYGGFSSGWYGYSSGINNNNNNQYYSGGINGSSYGYTGHHPVTSSRSSYSFQPSSGEHRVEDRTAAAPAAPWQTLTAADDRSHIEKRPAYLQLQTPFVGRWQSGVRTAQLETSSLPYSLLALDSLRVTGDGTTAARSVAGREVDGFADSYQADYQVYADNGNGEQTYVNSINNNNNSNNSNIDRTCSSTTITANPNDSLCIISAMLRRTVGDSAGDLHFPTEPPNQLRWPGQQGKCSSTTVGQHNSNITTPLLQPSPHGGACIGATDRPISRTPAQTAEGETVVTLVGPPVACAVSAFNCVRQANAATSTSVRRADGAQADRVRSEVDHAEERQNQWQQVLVVHSGEEGGSNSDSPHQLPAMRLNVPAAGLAEGGSRTSVYIPAEEAAAGGTGVPLPALTIQVNRLDPNNQQQNDVVNNAASGVSIVSCYRAANATSSSTVASARRSVASGTTTTTTTSGQEMMRENGAGGSGGGEQQQCNSVAARGEDRPEAISSEQGGVNTSDANVVMATEQMVQVSSVDRLLNVESMGEGGKGVQGEWCDGGGNSGALISAPAPSRTFTSTEAQTDDTIQQQHQQQHQLQHQQQHQHPPQPTQHLLRQHHPAGLVGPAAGFIGSSGASAVATEPLVTTMLGPPPGSEFSTREHRRRERRERRQARNRLQHIHPLEQPPAPLHRSPPPIEIIPDILHSHLPPPYTTLPMGASLIPQMIPANAVAAAAAAAAAAAIPVRAADDCRYTFPIPIMRR